MFQKDAVCNGAETRGNKKGTYKYEWSNKKDSTPLWLLYFLSASQFVTDASRYRVRNALRYIDDYTLGFLDSALYLESVSNLSSFPDMIRYF